MFTFLLFRIMAGAPVRFKATFGNEADSLFLRTALQALIKSETPIREVHFDPTVHVRQGS